MCKTAMSLTSAESPAFCFFVVAFNAPHRILIHRCGCNGVLGHEPDMLRDRSFQIFQGPESSSKSISLNIKNASFSVTTTEKFTLYDAKGQKEIILVTFSPFTVSSGNAIGCKICFEQFDGMNRPARAEIKESIPTPYIRRTFMPPSAVQSAPPDMKPIKWRRSSLPAL